MTKNLALPVLSSKASFIAKTRRVGAGRYIMTQAFPDIFGFTDYRAYLKSVHAHFKATKPHFSQRYFAKLAGFGGQSFLKMVMDGERNLTPDSVGKFARAFKLRKKEMSYFEALVFYNQAKSEEEKDRYFGQMMSLRPKTVPHGLTRDQFEYVTDNFFVIIREMSALPDFQEDPDWIAKALRYRVKPAQIVHALEVLQKLGLLIRDNNGKLKHSGKTLKSPLDADSIEIIDYHRRILASSKDAVMTSPVNEWDILSMTIPIPKEKLETVMEVLRNSFQEVVDIVNQGGREYHEVYQINMQFFPLTRSQMVKQSK